MSITAWFYYIIFTKINIKYICIYIMRLSVFSITIIKLIHISKTFTYTM